MSLTSFFKDLFKPSASPIPPVSAMPTPGTIVTFDVAFERLIGHEGKFTDDRKDKGNWTGGKVGVGELKGTKYGISAAAYPSLDIKSLTLEQAKDIYRRDYWERSGAPDYDGAIAYQVFDAAANHGIENAVRFLQRAAGVADDGDIGPITLSAINSMSVTDVLMRFNAARLRFYTQLSTWPDYSKGWALRIVGNLNYGAEDA